VVDVRPADIDIVEWRYPAARCESRSARQGKGKEEPDGSQKQAALRAILDVLVEQLADPRMP
jgi:polyferredoxin